MKTWAYLIAAAVLLALGYAYGERRYNNGVLAERTLWQGKQSSELVQANARIVQLTTAYRALENLSAQQIQAASKTYQEDLQHETQNRDRTIADLRTGQLRLRIQLAQRQPTLGSSTATPGAGPGRCDDPTVGELSFEAAEFLVGLASEADTVVHQLSACQAIVAGDRQISNQEGHHEQ